MQSAYIGKIMELAERNKNMLHVLADSGTGYDEMFRRNFPEQILNFGISEGNMVGAAAGLATVGKIPFVFTAGAFLAYRSIEFIRDDVCFQNQNVKITGMGSGLTWSSLGPTHHTTEDISVLRALPNLVILSPATPRQVAECLEVAYKHQGPVYIKIGMNHEKEFYTDDYKMELGQNDILRKGGDVTLLVTGSILEEVDTALAKLDKDGYNLNLVNVATLKPFNEMALLEYAKTSKFFITVEEHNIHGGLGSIVAETLAYHGVGIKVVPIGIEDKFAEGYGTIKVVREANKLDAGSLYQRISEVLQNA